MYIINKQGGCKLIAYTYMIPYNILFVNEKRLLFRVFFLIEMFSAFFNKIIVFTLVNKESVGVVSTYK